MEGGPSVRNSISGPRGTGNSTWLEAAFPRAVGVDLLAPAQQRCRTSEDGGLVGWQLCGRALGEVDVLALAHAYEQATDWPERTPPL